MLKLKHLAALLLLTVALVPVSAFAAHTVSTTDTIPDSISVGETVTINFVSSVGPTGFGTPFWRADPNNMCFDAGFFDVSSVDDTGVFTFTPTPAFAGLSCVIQVIYETGFTDASNSAIDEATRSFTIAITDPCDGAQTWNGIVPDCLSPGDTYRIMFVTSGTLQSNTRTIATYNTHVQNDADGATGTPFSGINFRALVSTSSSDTGNARTNTMTTDAGTNIRIFYYQGRKVADDYTDLYDGSWDTIEPRNQNGAIYPGTGSLLVWTGTDQDGTSSGSTALGSGSPRHGNARNAIGSINLGQSSSSLSRPLYALSTVLTAPASTTVDICDRTEEVRDAIVVARSASDCTNVDDLALVTGLNLNGMIVGALQSGDFAGLSGLTDLRLEGNSLNTLPPDIFSGLSVLSILRLNNNNLGSLDPDIFDGLSALTLLRLNENQLSALDTGIFDGLSALTNLRLDNNLLTALPADIFDGLNMLALLNLPANLFMAGTGLPRGIFDNVLDTVTTIGPAGLTVDQRVRDAHFVCSRSDFAAIVAATTSVADCLRITSAQLDAAIDATLSSLTVSDSGGGDIPLSPAFAPGTTAYAFNVANSVASVTVTPTAARTGAAITVNDAVVTSGNASNAIGLVEGLTTIIIEVTAAAGATTQTYALGITRLAPAADLVPSFGSALPLAPQIYTVGMDVGTVTLPMATGGDGTLTYTLVPALPPGLMFNGGNRQITGTPSATQPETTYTLTATDADVSNPDSVTFTFMLTVNPAVPVVPPTATLAAVMPLTEAMLFANTATVTITLANTEYVDEVSLTTAQFTVIDTVAGGDVTVSEVERTDSRLATLRLGFNGDDITTNSTLTVTVRAEGHTGAGDLPTGSVAVTASSGENVCGRTVQVRDAIVAMSIATECTSVTDFAAITSLVLNDRGITTLRSGDFAGLSGLETLEITRTQLSTLPDDIFSGLTALQTLSLEFNTFTARTGLPDGVFDPVLGTLVNFIVDSNIRAAHFVCSRDDADAIVAVTADVGDCLRITSAQLATAIPLVQADATLRDLTISDGTDSLILDPTFDPATNTYTVAVADSVEAVIVTPFATQGSRATITVNTDPVLSGSPSVPIALTLGMADIMIVVTSEDSMNTETYTLNVILAPPTAILIAPTPLTEVDLDGSTVTVRLINTEYVDLLDASHFTLSGDVAVQGGITVAVERTSTTLATLTFTHTTAVIADGILTVTVGAAGHTGSDDLIAGGVLITANTAPAFNTGESIDTQSYIEGVEISPLTLPSASGGNGALSYAISPSLPDGLNFDLSTLILSGTPVARTTQSATVYTYRVSDSDSDTDDTDTASLMLTIAIDDNPIGGTLTSTIMENAMPPTTIGLLTITGAEDDASLFAPARTTPANGIGMYGNFAVETAGLWTYTLDNDNPDVNALAVGVSLMDAFTVMGTRDGSRFIPQIVTITVIGANDRPVADAGPDQPADGSTIRTGTLVTLDGSFTDPDTGDIITYTWTQIGPTASTHMINLDTTTPATPTFTAPAVTTEIMLMFSLVVNDGTVDSAPDTVTIAVNPPLNTAPTFGAATIDAQTYVVGTGINVILPIATGGDGDLVYTLTPLPPEGLTFDPVARTITGTPVAMQPAITYTYTVGDSDEDTAVTDTASLTFTITVNQENITGDISGVVTEDATLITATGMLVITGGFNAQDGTSNRGGGLGTYGSLVLDTTVANSGAWTYTLDNNDPDTDALPVGTTETDVFYAVSALTAATSQAITISVIGANDAPMVDVSAPDTVNEDAGTVTLTGTGTDPDTGDEASLSYQWEQTEGMPSVMLINANTPIAAFSIPTDLAEGTDLTFMLTVTDSSLAMSTATVIISINADDDAAIIGGNLRGSVTEDALPTVTGTLTAADPDGNDNIFQLDPGFTGVYGDFGLTTTGAWTYTLDNERLATNALAAGIMMEDAFTVRSSDGTEARVIITVTGANDAATIGGNLSGRVTERGSMTEDALATAAGTLTADDPDGIDDMFLQLSRSGMYGNFGLIPTGAWTYTLNNDPATAQGATTNALAAGMTVTDRFTVRSFDGTEETVIITVTGANDVPMADAGADQPAVISDTLATLDGSGTDPDTGDIITYTWTQTPPTSATLRVTLSDNNVASPTFMAPVVTIATDLMFSLVVNDGTENSVTDTVTITLVEDIVPEFTTVIADQVYCAGGPIPVLDLPEATGGNPELEYTLTPPLPGLTFNGDIRTLSGTPEVIQSEKSSTYTVTDANDDTDDLTFAITVKEQFSFEFGSGRVVPPPIVLTEDTALGTFTGELSLRVASIPAVTSGGMYSLSAYQLDGASSQSLTVSPSMVGINSEETITFSGISDLTATNRVIEVSVTAMTENDGPIEGGFIAALVNVELTPPVPSATLAASLTINSSPLEVMGGLITPGPYALSQGSTAMATIPGTALSPAAPGGYADTGTGLFDFNISGVSACGRVQVLIPLLSEAPADARLFKYVGSAGGWNPFTSVMGGDNYYDSAASPCPDINARRQPAGVAFDPNVHMWRDASSGTQAGARCLLLDISDGGINDADGSGNGIVFDPSGLFMRGGGGGGHGGMHGLWLLLLFTGLLALRLPSSFPRKREPSQ